MVKPSNKSLRNQLPTLHTRRHVCMFVWLPFLKWKYYFKMVLFIFIGISPDSWWLSKWLAIDNYLFIIVRTPTFLARSGGPKVITAWTTVRSIHLNIFPVLIKLFCNRRRPGRRVKSVILFLTPCHRYIITGCACVVAEVGPTPFNACVLISKVVVRWRKKPRVWL